MKSKEELLRELDQTQQMINAAENAMRFGLTLDGDSFARYTDAMERQKQIADDLSGYEETSKGLVVSAAMHGKQSEIVTDTCVIEAVEELSRADFDDFRERLLRDYDFILDHSRSLMSGADGRYHCLLVLCEGEPDGILVDSEGSAYARYSGLLPDARLILEDRCQRVARDLLSEGKDSFSDTELRSRYGIDLFDGGCLQPVRDRSLRRRMSASGVREGRRQNTGSGIARVQGRRLYVRSEGRSRQLYDCRGADPVRARGCASPAHRRRNRRRNDCPSVI